MVGGDSDKLIKESLHREGRLSDGSAMRRLMKRFKAGEQQVDGPEVRVSFRSSKGWGP